MKKLILSMICIISVSFILGCDEDSNPTGSNENNNDDIELQYLKDTRLIGKWEQTMGVGTHSSNGGPTTFDTTYHPEDEYRNSENYTTSEDDIWKTVDDTLFIDLRSAGTIYEYWKKKELYSFRGDTLVLITVYWGGNIPVDKAPSSYWIPVID